MKVIKGVESARSLLSRQAPTELFSVPSSLKKRLVEMFGVDDPEVVVGQIIDEVRGKGDAALLSYTLKIDGVQLTEIEVTGDRIKDAYKQVDEELVSALKLAADRIGSFHMAQKKALWGELKRPGLGQLVIPLERVGVYAPGGTASYPSTVLMTAIPARVAGVKEVILVSPPGKSGSIPPLTLVAADLADVDRVFAVGGAQAVAALAYGTGSVPRVDKICGPGNIFVALAKKLVYGLVDIDGIQGPSEVLIIADNTADAAYCASDLLAQAEHDPLASSILVTDSPQLAEEVEREVSRQLKDLPRKEIATQSLDERGIIVTVASMDEAIELANLYAAEHLLMMIDKADSYLNRIKNAGCIVIGKQATVVLGDYIAGPSHALPTGGTARFSSPLNVSDFIKISSVINTDEIDVEKLGQVAQALARAEGLDAHARAMEKRLDG